MIKAALIVASLFLTGCAGIKANEPKGFECDGTGACWPSHFELTVPILYRYVDNPDAICRTGTEKTDADFAAHSASWRVFACTLLEKSPRPIIVLPKRVTPQMIACNITLRKLRQHEEGHAAGVTIHNTIERAC